MLPSFSFVIPAPFNEASRIGQTVRATLDYLQEVNPKNELIIVNDWSTDATATQIAREVLSPGRKSRRVYSKIFESRQRGGRPPHSFTGGTKSDRLAFFDADLSTPLEETPESDRPDRGRKSSTARPARGRSIAT